MLSEKSLESDGELDARIEAHYADKSMQQVNVNYAKSIIAKELPTKPVVQIDLKGVTFDYNGKSLKIKKPKFKE